MKKTVCIIQARMGSTRLPGKVAMDIGGKPMLARVVERANLVEGVHEVVVATSTLAADDRVAELSNQIGVPVFRGSEEDVLERYHDAAVAHNADVVVRVTADCPLLDPLVSSRVLVRYFEQMPDYASNTIQRSYPRGLDTEVLGVNVLEVAQREATELADREHVTRFVWRQPERFSLCSVLSSPDFSGWRWTVDTPEDLDLVRRIYGELGGSIFGMHETLALLQAHSEWSMINAHVEQKKL